MTDSQMPENLSLQEHIRSALLLLGWDNELVSQSICDLEALVATHFFDEMVERIPEDVYQSLDSHDESALLRAAAEHLSKEERHEILLCSVKEIVGTYFDYITSSQ
jgi:hypothetical protein